MSDLVHLSKASDAIASQRWQAYVDAKKIADDTLRVEDGIAAGRAWRDFLNVFEPGSLPGTVLPFPARARR